MKVKKIMVKEQKRNNINPFYRSAAWKKTRRAKLADDPNCEEHLKMSRVVIAEMVDHITPISQGGDKFDRSNLQSLCNHCHAVKRAKESNMSRVLDPDDDLAV